MPQVLQLQTCAVVRQSSSAGTLQCMTVCSRDLERRQKFCGAPSTSAKSFTTLTFMRTDGSTLTAALWSDQQHVPFPTGRCCCTVPGQSQDVPHHSTFTFVRECVSCSVLLCIVPAVRHPIAGGRSAPLIRSDPGLGPARGAEIHGCGYVPARAIHLTCQIACSKWSS